MDPILIKTLIFGSGIIVQSIIILGINKNFKKNLKTTLSVMMYACMSGFIVLLKKP